MVTCQQLLLLKASDHLMNPTQTHLNAPAMTFCHFSKYSPCSTRHTCILDGLYRSKPQSFIIHIFIRHLLIKAQVGWFGPRVGSDVAPIYIY